MSKELTKDTLGRALQDLRISVTDRCNFRCTYCMPKEVFGRGYRFLPHEELLTFEELTRLVKIFVTIGTRKLRITGGEPIMRREVEKLIAMLVEIPGIEDLALSTNGSFPIQRVQTLRQAGLKRMTVSLDSLDDKVFNIMNDVDFSVSRVLEWIETSLEAGFEPIKINMVVMRGVNEDSILPMARHFDRPNTILRFIEYMDVGRSNDWRLDDVVSATEIAERIHAEMPLVPLQPNYHSEVAKRWRYKESGNEIGLITSVTQPFCGDCTRARLSANGSLYNCLFSAQGHDLKSLLRSEAGDEEVAQAIKEIWKARTDRYSEIRSSQTKDLPKVEMSFIGG